MARNTVDSGDGDVPITTDDWPYLYQRDKAVPRPYWSISIIIVLLALSLYSRISNGPQPIPSLFFFCMGAASYCSKLRS